MKSAEDLRAERDASYEAYKLKQKTLDMHEHAIVPAIVEQRLTVIEALDFIIACSIVTPAWSDWQLAYWEPFRGPHGRDEQANVFELLDEEDLDENSLLLNALYDWEETAHPFAFDVSDAVGVIYEVTVLSRDPRPATNTAGSLAELSGDWSRPGLHGVQFLSGDQLDQEQLAALEITEEGAEWLRKLSFKNHRRYGSDLTPLIAKRFDANGLATRGHVVTRYDGRPLCRAEARYIDRNMLTQHRFEYYRGVDLQPHFGQFGGTMLYFPMGRHEPDYDGPLCYSCASELPPEEQDQLASDCSYNHDVYGQEYCSQCNEPIYDPEDIIGGDGDDEEDGDEEDGDE